MGGEITVPTLSGNVLLTVPSGTQPGQTFRLKGRGMPQVKNPSQHGDLLVRARVAIPRHLTAEQRELFKKLAGLA
jgi:curved DNA-binding protein